MPAYPSLMCQMTRVSKLIHKDVDVPRSHDLRETGRKKAMRCDFFLLSANAVCVMDSIRWNMRSMVPVFVVVRFHAIAFKVTLIIRRNEGDRTRPKILTASNCLRRKSKLVFYIMTNV